MQREYHSIPEDTTCPVSFRNAVSINYWNLIRIDTAALEKIDILFFSGQFERARNFIGHRPTMDEPSHMNEIRPTVQALVRDTHYTDGGGKGL
jgi:hypothetical protein